MYSLVQHLFHPDLSLHINRHAFKYDNVAVYLAHAGDYIRMEFGRSSSPLHCLLNKLPE